MILDKVKDKEASATQNKESEFYKKAIEKLFLIVDRNARTIPLILNEPQNKILSSLKGRDIILKARQEGISTLILALFTLDFIMKENIRCVVISHEIGATQKLFDKVKFFLEGMKKTFPGELPFELKYNSRHELVNKTKNSVFYIGTAGSKTFGHGDTIHNLHVSELSRWPNQDTLMVGLMQAVPRGGRIIVETTANGVGNYFYNLWKKAGSTGSTFRRHFLPWFALSEYKLPLTDGFEPDEDEQELQNAYGLSHEQLNWRRWKISEMGGDMDHFAEQFPSNAEEAFIVSGNPIWAPSLLKWYLHHCEKAPLIGNLIGSYQAFLDPNPKGYLKVWKEPKVGHSYVVGADVAEGIEVDSSETNKEKQRDYSAAVVMDRNTAEIVAIWHGHITGDQYGRQLDLLGRYYNNAILGVEKNFQGLAPLIMLRDLNYPRIYYREKIGLSSDKSTPEMGWRTDRFTRPMMIDELSKWLREKRIIIYDEELVGEMMGFVRYPDGQGRAATNAFDDRVIALMIAVQMYLRNPFTNDGNEIEKGDGEDLDSGRPIESFDDADSMGEGDFYL